jgi:hypothetical protein
VLESDSHLVQLLERLATLPHPDAQSSLSDLVLEAMGQQGVLRRRDQQLAELGGQAGRLRAAAAGASRALQQQLELLAEALGQPAPPEQRAAAEPADELQAGGHAGTRAALEEAQQLVAGQVGGLGSLSLCGVRSDA